MSEAALATPGTGIPRPLSLSVISVFAVLYGLITLFPKIMFAQSSTDIGWASELVETMSSSGPVPLPATVHISHAIAGSLVWVVAGVFLWRGRSWSRWLMTIWGLTVLFLTYSVYGFAGSFPWKTGVYILLLGLLFSPGWSRYLRARSR